ncbi:hypothetical protein STCU_10950 [Strigomonas culicis]|uniref:Uncharacterized protein n=1 Tax=Strigomonas culicis TaxID=28005 RepID=S9V1Z9_9TRYP|nr:hypothetical protein STCU_10950 [Strigomonas culicis]|eukprot:EPY16850.1 hypothetical protein STCU_10950 [Strigomonas culicis]
MTQRRNKLYKRTGSMGSHSMSSPTADSGRAKEAGAKDDAAEAAAAAPTQVPALPAATSKRVRGSSQPAAAAPALPQSRSASGYDTDAPHAPDGRSGSGSVDLTPPAPSGAAPDDTTQVEAADSTTGRAPHPTPHPHTNEEHMNSSSQRTCELPPIQRPPHNLPAGNSAAQTNNYYANTKRLLVPAVVATGAGKAEDEDEVIVMHGHGRSVASRVVQDNNYVNGHGSGGTVGEAAADPEAGDYGRHSLSKRRATAPAGSRAALGEPAAAVSNKALTPVAPPPQQQRKKEEEPAPTERPSAANGPTGSSAPQPKDAPAASASPAAPAALAAAPAAVDTNVVPVVSSFKEAMNFFNNIHR